MKFRGTLTSYKRIGFIYGAATGLLFALFCCLYVYACEYGFNPGGMNIPSGACEFSGLMYLPFLLMFLPAIFFGPLGLLIPSIIIVVLSLIVGGLLGWFMDRRFGSDGRFPLLRILIVIVVISWIVILTSIIVLFIDRHVYLSTLWIDYETRQGFKNEIAHLSPRYLPQDLHESHIDNEIEVIFHEDPESVRSKRLFGCSQDREYTSSLTITITRIGQYQEVLEDPRFGLRKEYMHIGEKEGEFRYYDQNTSTDDWTFNKYTKPIRVLMWSIDDLHVEIRNDFGAACIYPKEELIKIAESMQ